MREAIEDKLRRALQPVWIEVLDESENHRGHSGWREGGATHFRVRIGAAAFHGKTRLERHRMVNALLADELKGGVHALAIEAEPA